MTGAWAMIRNYILALGGRPLLPEWQPRSTLAQLHPSVERILVWLDIPEETTSNGMHIDGFQGCEIMERAWLGGTHWHGGRDYELLPFDWWMPLPDGPSVPSVPSVRPPVACAGRA